MYTSTYIIYYGICVCVFVDPMIVKITLRGGVAGDEKLIMFLKIFYKMYFKFLIPMQNIFLEYFRYVKIDEKFMSWV